MNLSKLLKTYDFHVPEKLIAQAPAMPRDSARLLVYERKSGAVHFDRFCNLAKYLPQGAVLVFNETRVLPARLELFKPTGGRVRVLCLDTEKNLLKVMSDRALAEGQLLRLKGGLFFKVQKQQDKYYYLKPSFPIKNLHKVLDRYGLTPIPPYIKHSPLSEKQLREQYQSVFARRSGSSAAPTASLHFTPRLLKQLSRAGFSAKFVTLHVGLGTFAPLTAENLQSGRLHEERYEIDKPTAAFLNQAKKTGRPIVAVGTTAVRTLEAACGKPSRIKAGAGATQLFIREGYQFKFVDALITNFHVPRSSLLMLVAALAGRQQILELYQKAATRKFRFFSFGDGMLIL
jgi:S-adenosylmethionine:tRNA ribosyltransferase-isomerase